MAKSISIQKTVACCILSAAVAFSGSYAIMRYRFNAEFPTYSADEAVYGKIGEIRRTIDSYYIGEYETEDAVDMAATGYVAGIGDIWSSYMSKEDYEDYTLSFSGKSFGVGLYTSYSDKQNKISIVEVFKGSDDEKLGLKKGDIILGAEDKTVEIDGYQATIDAVAGEEGTMATLTILRADTGETETVQMERKTTEQTMASGYMLSDGKTGMIRIYNFRKGSEQQMIDQVDKLLGKGATQLIFDVRNNPGGAVVSVCDALDYLLPEGKIMTLKTKAGDETVYESDKNEINIPMAVIVNADSISAAEFFAAALQEYDKAIVIGEKTIGKGYSQQNYVLSDGSALHLSDQEYFTPNGKTLIGTGVEPDVVSEPGEDFDLYFSSEIDDIQLQTALKALSE